MLLRSLCILVATASFADSPLAQDGAEKTSPRVGDVHDLQAIEEGKEDVIDKAEPESTGPRAGLRNHMTMLVAVKPRRIPPGGTGRLQVVLAMRNDAVLLPSSHLDLLLPDAMGPLLPGGWRIQDAAAGKLDTAFRGQPVYDNTAVAEVDIQVSQDATYGKHRFSFRVEAEVTDGRTGASRGLFMDMVNGEVEVGDPLPTPVVRTAAAGGDAPVAGAGVRTPDRGASAGQAPDGPQGAEPIGGRVASGGRPDAEPSGAGLGAGSAAYPDGEDEGMPTFLLIGGGVLLLLIGLLFVFRGR